MSNEDRYLSHREGTPIRIERAATKEEIERYFAFADPLLGGGESPWGESGPTEEYTPAYIIAHPELTQVFIIKDRRGEIVAGSKVKKVDDNEKQRLGLNTGAFATQEGALLEYTVIKEEHRNQGLLQRLTDDRIAWAKEKGAQYVCAEAEITNPISVYTKLRDGFILVGIQEPSAGIPDPYFVEIKALDKQNSENESLDYKEVVIDNNSFENLKTLFADGWVGIDIKGTSSDPTLLEIPWILIMGKSSV